MGLGLWDIGLDWVWGCRFGIGFLGYKLGNRFLGSRFGGLGLGDIGLGLGFWGIGLRLGFWDMGFGLGFGIWVWDWTSYQKYVYRVVHILTFH